MKHLLFILFCFLQLQLLAQPIFIKAVTPTSKNYIGFDGKVFYTSADTLWAVTENLNEKIVTGLDSAHSFIKTRGHLFFEDKSGLWVLKAGTSTPVVYELSDLSNPVILGDETIFWAKEKNTENKELYKINSSNTVELIKDINPGSAGSFINKETSSFKVAESKIYVVANDGINGNDLWVTDGTAEGTKIAFDHFSPNSTWRTEFAINRNDIYFFTDSSMSFTLWKSDGSSAPIEIRTFQADSIDVQYQCCGIKYKYLYHGGIQNLGTSLVFETASADSNHYYSVSMWNYNYSTNRIELLKEIPYWYDFSAFPWKSMKIENKAIFIHTINADWNQIWLTDGTIEKTKNIWQAAGGPERYLESFFYVGSHPVFSHNVAEGYGFMLEIEPNGSLPGVTTNKSEESVNYLIVNSNRYIFYKDHETQFSWSDPDFTT